jgi:hypothetical protein
MTQEKKRSILDAAREHKIKNKLPPTEKPHPPIEGWEDVKATCGHTVRFPLYVLKKDKFREQRRLNMTSTDCPDCKQKNHLERTRKDQEARQARLQKGRLPHQSKHEAIFDAVNTMWSGRLTTTSPEGKELVFHARSPSLAGCNHLCYKHYLKWLKDHEKPRKPVTSAEDTAKMEKSTVFIYWD